MRSTDYQLHQGFHSSASSLAPWSAASALESELPKQGAWRAWNTWLTAATQSPSPIEFDAREEVRRAIEAAVEAHPWLANQICVYTKGSIANETNVQEGSDLDIAIEWLRTPRHGKPGDLVDRDYVRNERTPRSPSPEELRAWVIEALQAHSLLTRNLLLEGDKSIKIEPDTPATEAIGRAFYVDVVPCYTLFWCPDRQPVRSGIRLFSSTGKIIDNWPDHHSRNGRDKQAETDGRYKQVVRALKTLRYRFVQEGLVDPERLRGFTVESLVWNVPSSLFGGPNLIDDVADVIRHLHEKTSEPWLCGGWTEADGFSPLFRPAKRTPSASHQFLADVREALGVLSTGEPSTATQKRFHRQPPPQTMSTFAARTRR